MEAQLLSVCPKCAGIGVYHKDTVNGTVTTDPCPTCNGSGRVVIGYVDITDIMAALDNIKQKVGKDV